MPRAKKAASDAEVKAEAEVKSAPAVGAAEPEQNIEHLRAIYLYLCGLERWCAGQAERPECPLLVLVLVNNRIGVMVDGAETLLEKGDPQCVDVINAVKRAVLLEMALVALDK
jgi:hypothetical protein